MSDEEAARVDYRRGDTERDTINRSLFCGQLPTEALDGSGCGARDWRVFSCYIMPPWARVIICQRCGERTFIEIPGLKTDEERRRENGNDGRW